VEIEPPDQDSISCSAYHFKNHTYYDLYTSACSIRVDHDDTPLLHAYSTAFGLRTASDGPLLDHVDNLMSQEASIDAAFLPPNLFRQTLLQAGQVRVKTQPKKRKRKADDKGRVCKLKSWL
jgi:hypothetical protein